MLLYVLLFLLITSFVIHIVIIVFYVQTRSSGYFNWFIITVITNMAIAIALSIVALTRPEEIRKINIRFFFWLLSGFIMILLVFIKFIIFRRIYRRTKDPNWYHFNYFGKKVYNNKIVQPAEFMGFIVTFPFFLFIGAYFVARLINLFLYGHI